MYTFLNWILNCLGCRRNVLKKGGTNGVKKECSTLNIINNQLNLNNKWNIDYNKELGKGKYGSVYYAKDKSGNIAAIKKIRKDLKTVSQSRLVVERECLNRIKNVGGHPNIINLLDHYECDLNSYFVFDYHNGIELFNEIIKRFDNNNYFLENELKHLVRTIYSCISFLHGIGIIHRDIKPENFIYIPFSQKLILIDFGLSKIQVSTVKKTKMTCVSRLGTSYYIAPEVLKRNYNHLCDIWSGGVLTYILCIGYPPFNGATTLDIYNKIRYSEISFNDIRWNILGKSCKSFIKKILERDLNERLDAKEALNHDWLKN